MYTPECLPQKKRGYRTGTRLSTSVVHLTCLTEVVYRSLLGPPSSRPNVGRHRTGDCFMSILRDFLKSTCDMVISLR